MNWQNKDDPQEIVIWLHKIIASSTKVEHLKCCKNLIDNYKILHGSKFTDQLYQTLAFHSLQLKAKIYNSRFPATPKEKTNNFEFGNEIHNLIFVKDSRGEIFAYFMDFKTQWDKLLCLCYFKGEFCELSKSYVEEARKNDIMFQEYANLLNELKTKGINFNLNLPVHFFN